MHNRLGPRARSYDISLLDGAVLAPMIAVIVFLALYPQLALHRSERSVKNAVAPAHLTALCQTHCGYVLVAEGDQQFVKVK
jgi:NADH:ubiquinone oxidoreductase subunit 4 (subunit M)